MMLVQMSQTLQNQNFINSMPLDFQLTLVEEFVTFLSLQMIDLKVHQRQSNLKKGLTKNKPEVEREVICDKVFTFLEHYFNWESHFIRQEK